MKMKTNKKLCKMSKVLRFRNLTLWVLAKMPIMNMMMVYLDSLAKKNLLGCLSDRFICRSCQGLIASSAEKYLLTQDGILFRTPHIQWLIEVGVLRSGGPLKLYSSYRVSLDSLSAQFCFFSIPFPGVNPKGTP